MTIEERKNRRAKWLMWSAVVFAFVLLIVVWTSMVLLARSNPVESVPLEEPPSNVEN